MTVYADRSCCNSKHPWLHQGRQFFVSIRAHIEVFIVLVIRHCRALFALIITTLGPIQADPLTFHRSFHSQLIRHLVLLLSSVSFDPLKRRETSAKVPIINDLQDLFDELFVLHGLSLSGLPTTLAPVDEPGRDAVYCIFGVGVDAHGAIHRRDAEGAFDSRQFGTIVCLATLERLSYISRMLALA